MEDLRNYITFTIVSYFVKLGPNKFLNSSFCITNDFERKKYLINWNIFDYLESVGFYLRFENAKWHPDSEYDSKTLNARIDKPDGSLIEKTPSLIEQLEIEAEFEVHKKKFVRLKPNIVAKDSDEGAIPKIEFISLVEHRNNTTSRPTQTKNTSLGKKSKLRDKRVQIKTDKTDQTVKTVKINA